MKNVLYVGALVRFLKSGSLCRIVKMNDDGTFTVARIDTKKEMHVPSAAGLELIYECSCCARMITPGREVWMAYDAVTDLFHPPGEVPDGHESPSTLFPLGRTCSKKQHPR